MGTMTVNTESKHVRMQMSESCLTHFLKPTIFFVLVHDHRWDVGQPLPPPHNSETKQQSKQWKYADSPPSKKSKDIKSARKFMASVFLKCKRDSVDTYLPIGPIIKGGCYSGSCTNYYKRYIKKARFSKRKVIFHQENACLHMSLPWLNKWTEVWIIATSASIERSVTIRILRRIHQAKCKTPNNNKIFTRCIV